MHDNILDQFDFDDHLFLDEGDDREVVAKYYSPLEGEVAAARLRSEGIPCFLANSTSQSILPHLQLVTRLHVRPQDMETARAILGEAAIDAGQDKGAININWKFAIGLITAVAAGLYLARIWVGMLPKK
jgi:Putative prokaryotic signal transducing protein